MRISEVQRGSYHPPEHPQGSACQNGGSQHPDPDALQPAHGLTHNAAFCFQSQALMPWARLNGPKPLRGSPTAPQLLITACCPSAPAPKPLGPPPPRARAAGSIPAWAVNSLPFCACDVYLCPTRQKYSLRNKEVKRPEGNLQ